jgi:glycosyltransferase involved in cell wall biosynthesis
MTALEIFIPAYGPSPYLEECLLSVFENDPSLFSCTVIDDCSPDSAILETVKKFPNRVRYIRNQSNIGLSANFQKAFELSTADFTVVMGSDDRLQPDFVEKMVDAILKFPSVFLIHPNVQVIDEHGLEKTTTVDYVKKLISPKSNKSLIITSNSALSRLLIGDWMYFPSIAWNTNEIRKFRLDTSFKSAVDLDLLVRICSTENEFLILPQTIFDYRRHRESVSSQLLLDSTRIMEELGIHIEAASSLRKQKCFAKSLLALFAPTVRIHAIKVGLFDTKGLRPKARAFALALKIK